jgi:hypothetical protein
MRASRPTIAGILIPDSAIAREAAELVQEVTPPLLFHHSSRVFLWCSFAGRTARPGLRHDAGDPTLQAAEVRLVTVGVEYARFQD